ncbi:MAG: ATP-binding protein [Nitrospinae bacterium]|nr:ATP-binding protein [Nitrospinota bacterium]
MKVYERAQKSTILQRLDEDPQRLIVVTGPRQTGKTTLVRQVLDQIDQQSRYLPVDEPDRVTLPPVPGFENDTATLSDQAAVSFSEVRDTRWLVRQWEQARVDAGRSERGFVLVIDEVQKIPNWSETVKGLWDADRRHAYPLHVVLLGSAPLLMQKGMSESLAGRYETIHLTHWSFAEMSAAFDFDFAHYIYFGGYPGAASLVRDYHRWREYIVGSLIEPNIERDILAMQRVDKPALLKRLFELGAEYSGQILSYNKMLGQLQDAGNTTTLARYLELLSDAGLLAGLSGYARGAHRRRASSPKLNVLNTALMSSQSGYTFEEARADRSFWGRLVESAVGAHLFNTKTPEVRLHFWRDRNHEVDFVLERGRRLVAFEVKSGVRKSNVSGLRLFGERFDVMASIVVGEGGVALPEFLSVPAGEWFESS